MLSGFADGPLQESLAMRYSRFGVWKFPNARR